jgi:hypothetical protein
MADLDDVLQPKSPPRPAGAEQPAPPPPLHAEIDRWFQDSFHGTRLGNDTETWNLVHAAKEELKQRLGKLV